MDSWSISASSRGFYPRDLTREVEVIHKDEVLVDTFVAVFHVKHLVLGMPFGVRGASPKRLLGSYFRSRFPRIGRRCEVLGRER